MTGKKFSRLLFGCFFSFLCSCNTYKNVSYFSDFVHRDTLINTINIVADPLIKPGDLLAFNITTLDLLTNVQGIASPTAQLNLPANSYRVDNDGIIELPIIGKVKVTALTVNDAKELLRTRYGTYYKNFSLTLAFVNHKISILGEVGRPGNFDLISEKMNIFEALAMAGDITVFGKKENVLLMRDTAENKKQLVRLDLNSKKIVSSPYFYLKENDVVYIEATRAKLASTDAYRDRSLRILTTALTVIIILLTRIIK